MSRNCVVCRGSKRIRVPVYQWAHDAPITGIEDSLALTESSREYPCPECSAGDNVPFERLGIVKGAREYPEHLATNREFIERLRYGMAQELVHGMVDRGLIRFEQGEPDARGIFQTRATAGVVAPAKVAAFEERVAERQLEVAGALLEQTESDINVWGSLYGVETVKKAQAIAWLRESFNKVRKRYVGK